VGGVIEFDWSLLIMIAVSFRQGNAIRSDALCIYPEGHVSSSHSWMAHSYYAIAIHLVCLEAAHMGQEFLTDCALRAT
jgi:hypothetical protein